VNLSLMHLAALLSGLGARAPGVLAELGTAPSAVHIGRSCVDAGAGAVFAVRAPGPRALDIQVRRNGAPAEGVEHWDGVRADSGGELTRWSRTVWRGRATAPAEITAAGALSWCGRVWSIERSEDGAQVTLSWQLDRHRQLPDVLALAKLPAYWPVAAAVLDRLHGFPVSTTSGPWSIALRLDDPGAPVRIGTTRWAWSVDDTGKRARLADLISGLGGDRAFATALYDLLTRSGTTGRLPVGRAVEVDVAGDTVVAVAAYLVAPAAPATALRTPPDLVATPATMTQGSLR
jgi:hypothetical protein